MSLTNRIATNAVMQTAGRITGTVLGLFTLGIMTRGLGTAGYGTFTTAMTFVQFFAVLADFGLTITMTKLISESGADEDAVAANVFSLRLVTAAALFAVAPIAALAFEYGPDIRMGIAISALSFFAMSASQVLVGVFQKHLASHLAAGAEVLGRATLLAAAYYASQSGMGLAGFFWAVVLGNVLQLAASLVAVRRFVRLQFAINMQVWKRVIQESWPIGVSIAFNLLYLKGDIIALSLWRTQTEVGLYGAAYKVLDVLTVIPMIFMGLVLPVLTLAWSSGDKAAFRRRMSKSFDALVLLAVPLAAGTFAVSSDLMTLVGGPQFAASGPILNVLMLAAALVFIAALFNHAIVALGMQKPMIWAYALNAAISVALYWWFIPRSGVLAAAWITVFSEAFILVLGAIAVAHRAGMHASWKVPAVAVCASALMMVVLHGFSAQHVMVRVALGVTCYGLTVLASGVVNKEAMALLGMKPESV